MKKKLSMAGLIISIITFTGCAAMTPVYPTKQDSEYYIDKKEPLAETMNFFQK
ncbi:MAG: hypothetical protein KAH62_06415 [Desulfobacula sp.]|nr:hypothetical protein [Desulfobacula sp.]